MGRNRRQTCKCFRLLCRPFRRQSNVFPEFHLASQTRRRRERRGGKGTKGRSRRHQGRRYLRRWILIALAVKNLTILPLKLFLRWARQTSKVATLMVLGPLSMKGQIPGCILPLATEEEFAKISMCIS